MLKLLRKYNKWILAVGGSVLMVVFLLPSLQGMGRSPAGIVVATIDGEKITLRDEQNAQQELLFLRSLEPRVEVPLDVMFLRVGVGDQESIAAQRPGLHWLMLTKEAQRNGMVGGPQDGRSFLFDLSSMIVGQEFMRMAPYRDPAELEAQLPAAQRAEHDALEAARADYITSQGAPERWVDGALAKARGVLRLYNAYLNFDQPGLPESAAIAQRYYDKATIDFFLIDAAQRVDPDWTPSEDEVALQYALHKNTARGQGEHGFGYRDDDQVKFEWIRVSRLDVQNAVTVSAVEANAAWRADRVKYAGDFNAERGRVVEDLRALRVDAVMKQAEQAVLAEAQKSQTGLTRTEAGRFVLPEGWAGPALSAIAEAVGQKRRAQHGASIPNPLIDSSGEFWVTRGGVLALPSVGHASMQVGPNRVPLTDLVFSTAEIDPESPFRVQTGVLAGPLLAQPPGDVVFFRVTAARPAGEPGLEMVRGLVVEDLRRLEAFNDLVNQAPEIRGRVVAEGMAAAAESFGATLRRGVGVERRGMGVLEPSAEFGPRDLQPINTETVRNAIVDRVDALDDTRPLNELPPEELVVTIPLPATLALLVSGIRDTDYLSIESLRDVEAQALQEEMRRRESGFINWPYTPEALTLRYGLRLITRGPAGEEEDLEFEAEEIDAPSDGAPAAPAAGG